MYFFQVIEQKKNYGKVNLGAWHSHFCLGWMVVVVAEGMITLVAVVIDRFELCFIFIYCFLCFFCLPILPQIY